MSQPIVITAVVAGILLLALVVLALAGLRDPRAAAHRVEALFRKPLKAARKPSDNHYYKRYWS